LTITDDIDNVISKNDPRFTVTDGVGTITKPKPTGKASQSYTRKDGYGCSDPTLDETHKNSDGQLDGRVKGSASELGITVEEWSTIKYTVNNGSGISDIALPYIVNAPENITVTRRDGYATNDYQMYILTDSDKKQMLSNCTIS